MADPPQPGLVVVHPDPRLRAEIVAALADRGYSVTPFDQPRPARQPSAAVVIADHTQLPLAVSGPLLVLVPTHEHGAILAAFAAGADDVLAGPLRPTELATRVAILARAPAPAGRLTVGPIIVDTLSRAVVLDGTRLELTPAEYDLLATLAAAPGRVFTKQELLHATARPRARSSHPRSTRPHRRIDTQAARLRRRLGEHRGLLVTVWGVGYRLG